ncbi:MAG TPA: glycosyltransferase family 9 protein [Pirellulales bacterium]|nr:glycosyltransferase family 9 protein [Pirellulales bacterium]
MSRLTKPLRSLGNLLRLTIDHAGRAVRAAWCRDGEAVGVHIRSLLLAWLDDISQTLVRLQSATGWRRLTGRRIDHILVIKLDRIGDMVTTLPAFDALLEKYPGAKLDVVGHPLPLQLLAGDERINERIDYCCWLYHPLRPYPPGVKTLALVARLMCRRYPLVVCLRGSFSFLPLAFTSRLAATKFMEGEPVVRRYLRAIEAVVGPVKGSYPRLAVDLDARKYARHYLTTLGDSGPRIAIHATASGGAKIWPAERFAALADELRRRCGAVVCFLGAPADESAMRKISGLAHFAHVYRTNLKLQQSVALISECDLFIGNDSGLAHAAAAVDTPSVVIWGAPNLSMARPMARPGACIVLYHDLPCRSTCLEYRCHHKNTLECLTRTEVDYVIQAAEKLLESARTSKGALSCVPSI